MITAACDTCPNSHITVPINFIILCASVTFLWIDITPECHLSLCVEGLPCE